METWGILLLQVRIDEREKAEISPKQVAASKLLIEEIAKIILEREILMKFASYMESLKVDNRPMESWRNIDRNFQYLTQVYVRLYNERGKDENDTHI